MESSLEINQCLESMALGSLHKRKIENAAGLPGLGFTIMSSSYQ